MFSTRRVLQSRLRNLGTQSQLLLRLRSPSSRNTSTITQQSAPEGSKWPRRLIYAGVFGGLGVAAGKWMDARISAPVEPETTEDGIKLEEIRRVYEIGLPIVQELRSNPDYVEVDVYGNFSEEDKKQRLTSGPLKGSRALAVQKVFWNDKEQKAISVVYLGNGMEGWPTVVHGGALATVIDENLGRVAIRSLPARTGVTANLEINYRAPVYSGNFYTFHSSVDRERSTDRKAYVTGEVRDPVGRLCVQASALFVVPKKYNVKEIGERF
ncbi:HotDog domain-containing protein [Aspergillus bertholletiae]|uniref:HotDog domain-containing protein n=1 Tax=Aspergillus bertholletiae TaxID=1226010 RepID=A0A5N7AQV8_9EURO|nr:HotDog domain-containing protein [Aspergillus bertholletiae]